MRLITEGSHTRFNPVGSGAFAHAWLPNDPEGREVQAWNFITYANALGGSDSYVLVSPDRCADEAEWEHECVEMTEWAQIVESATGKHVEIE